MKIRMGLHPIGGLGVPYKDCFCRNCEAARPKLTAPRCDDREVMRLWRECGLPEYFLGNGGTNHKLVEFARRIRDVSA